MNRAQTSVAYLEARASIAFQVAQQLWLSGNVGRCQEMALVAVQAATDGASRLGSEEPKRKTLERQASNAAQLAFHCSRNAKGQPES